MTSTKNAQDLIEALLKGSQIAFKTVWVGRSGSVLLTFYSREMAERASVRIADFSTNLRIADGCYDDTPNGAHKFQKVCRVAGMMAA